MITWCAISMMQKRRLRFLDFHLMVKDLSCLHGGGAVCALIYHNVYLYDVI